MGEGSESYLHGPKHKVSFRLYCHLVTSQNTTPTLQKGSWSAYLLWVFANSSDLREEPQACTQLRVELGVGVKEEMWCNTETGSQSCSRKRRSHTTVTLILLTHSRTNNVISCQHYILMFILKHRDCLSFSGNSWKKKLGVRSCQVIPLQDDLCR